MRGHRVQRVVRPLLAAAALSVSAVAPALAQRRPALRAGESPRRALLERQFRQRGDDIVRRQLKLSDDQMRRLRDVNGPLDSQRHTLVQQEHDARVALRDEMARGSSADQGRVAQLMAQVRTLQAQRFALHQQEMQQISGFLTPVQQAQYDALVTRLRERARALHAANDSAAGTP